MQARFRAARSLMFPVLAGVAGGLATTIAVDAGAATYGVGPNAGYRQFSELPTLQPGDLVEVEGGATYDPFWFQDDGTAAEPIVIRGLRSDSGERPRIEGGTNTVELMGDHIVFEGFDVSGGSSRCVYHHAHDIVVRDCVIHDCPAHGLLGADGDSGSLLLEYTEIYRCGEGSGRHQIYMSTDQIAHPDSVFRMQYCYLHDGNGGNGVKSRAERNEIYYNWIEGSYYHELELIGPDPGGTPVDEDFRLEHSDVVGNVFVKSGLNTGHWIVRFGGDATGQSWASYRFVNNTVVLAPDSAGVFRLFDGILSLEASNNVIYQTGSGDAQIVRDLDADWASGRQVTGTNNWLVAGTGFRDVPSQEWQGTLEGTDPGFEDLAGRNLRPAEGSPLIDAGATTLPGYDFPNPEPVPLFHPPDGVLLEPGTAQARPDVDTVDIGAYEFGSGSPVVATGGSGGAPLTTGGNGTSGGDGASGGDSASGGNSASGADDKSGGAGIPGGAGTPGDDRSRGGDATSGSDGTSGGYDSGPDSSDDGGCGCRTPSSGGNRLGILLAFGIVGFALRRRGR